MGWRGHAEWWGWDHSDIYFPAFLFAAGAGLAHQTRDKPMPWNRLGRRALTLVVLGLLVNAWLAFGPDLALLRFPGVLQRIGLVGLVGAVVVVASRRRWLVTALVAVALAVGWSLLLWAGGDDCPGGRPTPEGCGTFVEVDRAAFGEAHLYRQGQIGYDPEGLPSSLGALATFLSGYAAVRLTVRQDGLRRRALALVAMAGGWAALLVPLLALQPLNKRLWTGSFVAANAAAHLVLLAVLVLALDRARGRITDVVLWPVEALARNALVIWIGLFTVARTAEVTRHGERSVAQAFLEAHGSVAYLAVFGGLWLLVACAMHAARWYVRL